MFGDKLKRVFPDGLRPDRNELIAGGVLVAAVTFLWFALPYIVN